MTLPPVYICSAARTPIGSYLGSLATVSAPELGACAIKAAVERAGLASEAVQEVFMGNVLSAGIGQAPARQASRAAGLPDSAPTTTVSKVCGSGLQAVILAARTIALGDAGVVVAGGMESMSRVPYYLEKAREGYRMGNGQLIDGMLTDGLFDPYHNYPMGEAAELCSEKYELSREAQDDFATHSYSLALAAQAGGLFDAEIVPVSVPQRKGEAVVVSEDEEPGRGKLERFPTLRPAFKKDGTITAANASSINDGAAALILASESAIKEQGLTPIARITGYGAGAQAPEWFTTAPALAIDNVLRRNQLQADQIDLWEINEAFACVTMACCKLAGVDPSRVNVNGGAVALGHPIGASGARILTTLLYALEQKKLKTGMASLCIGGGEAVAVLIERL